MTQQVEGRVVQVIGPVVDVEFPDEHLPAIYNAVRIVDDGTLGVGTDRRHRRGRPAPRREPGPLHRHAADRRHGPRHDGGRHRRADLGAGRPQDAWAACSTCSASRSTARARSTPRQRMPIHRPAPALEEQSTETEMFETGIKVVDLLEPYTKGGKIGLFGGAGVGKTVIIMELINNIAHAARRLLGVRRCRRADP